MNYRVDTPGQLGIVLRALRKTQGLNQTELGVLLGVSQRRIAAIEKSPAVTGFDQISRLISVLGGKLVVELNPPPTVLAENDAPPASAMRPRRKTRAQTAAENGDW
jgi:HTH-type transcriptional regulator/antitoxin HipB